MAVILGSIGVTFTGDTTQYADAVRQVEAVTDRSMSRVRSSVALTDRSIQSLHRTMGQPVRFSSLIAASRGFDGLNERANVLRGTILATTAVFGGFAAALATNVVLRYADSYTQLENRTRVVSASTAELTTNLLAIRAAADQSRSGLTATSTLFSRLSKAAPTKTANDVLGYVSTIQKALALGGATAEESASAALQFSQAIASNRLGGDEFRAILETPLGLELAKGLGVTIGKLKEMSVAGQLTSDVVLGALSKIKGGIDKAFAGSTETLDQSLIKLDNALIVTIGGMNKTYGITKTLTGGFDALARNADTIAPAIAAVATLLGTLFSTRFIGRGVTNIFTNFAANTQALRGNVDAVARSLAQYRVQQLAATASVVQFSAAARQKDQSGFAPQSLQSGVLRAQQAELALQQQSLAAAARVTQARKAAQSVTIATLADSKKIIASKDAEKKLDVERIGRQAALARSYQQLQATVAVLPAGATSANEKLIATETRIAAIEAERIRIVQNLAAAHANLAQIAPTGATSSPADVAARQNALKGYRQLLAEKTAIEDQMTAVQTRAANQRIVLDKFEGTAEGKALEQQAAIRRSIIVQEGALNTIYTQQAAQNSRTRLLSEEAEAASSAKNLALKNKNYGEALKAGLQVAALNAQAGAASERTAGAQSEAHAAGQKAVAEALAEAAEREEALSAATALTSLQLAAANRNASLLGRGFNFVKASASGLLGALGGPLGLALAAGAVGFEVYAAKAAAAASQQERFDAALREAAANANPVVAKSARSEITEQAQKDLDAQKAVLKDITDQAKAGTANILPVLGIDQPPAELSAAVAKMGDLIDRFTSFKITKQEFTGGLDEIGTKFPVLSGHIAEVESSLRNLQGAMQIVENAQKALNATLISGPQTTTADAVSAAIAAWQAEAKAAAKEVSDFESSNAARATEARVNGYEAQAKALEALDKKQAELAQGGKTGIDIEARLPAQTTLEAEKIALAEVTSLAKELSGGKLIDTSGFDKRIEDLAAQLTAGRISLQSFFAQAEAANLTNPIREIGTLTDQLVRGTVPFKEFQFALAQIGASHPELRPLVTSLTQSEEAAKFAAVAVQNLSAAAQAADHSSVTIFFKIAESVAGGSVGQIGRSLTGAFENLKPQAKALQDVTNELDDLTSKRRAFEAGGEIAAKVEEELNRIRRTTNQPFFGAIEADLRSMLTQIELDKGAVDELAGSLASKINARDFGAAFDDLVSQLASGAISLRSFSEQINAMSLAGAIQNVAALTNQLKAGSISFEAYKFKLAEIAADQPDLRKLIQGLMLSEDAAKKATITLDNLAAAALRLDGKTITIAVKIVGATVEGLLSPFEHAFEGAFQNFKAQAKSVADVQKQLDEARARKSGFDTGGDIGAKVEGEIAKLRAEQGVPFAPGAEDQLRKQLTEIETINKAISDGKKEANAEEKAFERTADILDRIAREGQGAFLGDIDREVIAKTAKIQNAAVLVRQYIAAIESGDLSKAPAELLQVREALLQVGSADTYRGIIQNMGEGAQLTQLFADKQEQLQFLISKGKITAGQAAQSWTEFVTGFKDYSWINDVGSALDQFGLSAITNFKDITSAITSLKDALIKVVLETFVLGPLIQQMKNLMAGFFPSLAGLVNGGGTAGAGGVAAAAVGALTGNQGLNTIGLGSATANPAAASNIAGGGVAGQVWNYFKAKGLGDQDVAAILGNVHQESGFNPIAIGPGGDTGLFQDLGSRKTDLFNNIGGAGNLGDVTKQLDNAWRELQGPEKATLEKLLAAPDLKSKTAAFLGFERPGGYDPNNPTAQSSFGSRYGSAQDYLSKFQGSADKLAPSLDSAAKATDTLSQSVTTQATPAIADMTKSVAQVPPVTTQAAAGTDQLTNSLGNQGGGFLGALKSLFGGGFNFGSDVGAPVTGTGILFHGGGGVGVGGMPRSVAGSWAAAPRFHDGLSPNEFKAVLMRGESVLTENMTKRSSSVIGGLAAAAAGSGRDNAPKVIINPPAAHEAKTRTEHGVDGYQVVVDIVSSATARGRFDAPNAGRYNTKPRKVS